MMQFYKLLVVSIFTLFLGNTSLFAQTEFIPEGDFSTTCGNGNIGNVLEDTYGWTEFTCDNNNGGQAQTIDTANNPGKLFNLAPNGSYTLTGVLEAYFTSSDGQITIHDGTASGPSITTQLVSNPAPGGQGTQPFTISFTAPASGQIFLRVEALTGTVYWDDFSLLGTSPPPVSPGGVSTNISLWLKADVDLFEGSIEKATDNVVQSITQQTGIPMGQSFTASSSGNLTSIQALVKGNNTPGSTSGTLRIYAGTPGASTALHTQTVSIVEGTVTAPIFNNYELSTSIPVTANSLYSWELTPTNGELTLVLTTSSYTSGDAYINGSIFTNNDWVFVAEITGSAATNGSDVALWKDQSGSSYNLGEATGSGLTKTLPNVVANKINFNPAVDFDSGDMMTNSTGVIQGISAGNPFTDLTVFVASLRDTPGESNVLFTLNDKDNNVEKVLAHYDRTTANSQAIWDPQGTGNRITGSPTIPTVTGESSVGTFVLSSTTGRQILINDETVASNTNPVNITNINATSFGGFDGANQPSLDTNLGEFIVYNGDITGAERDQILSYLAIKYGATLNYGATTYLNSDATPVWAADTNYPANIFGIARDDAQGLNQEISKSENTGAIVTLSTDSDFTKANDGSRIDLTDGQYLISGFNGVAPDAWTVTGAPANYARMGSQWKVQNTGSVGAINLQIDASGFPAFNGDLYLVKGSDLSAATPIAMTDAGGGLWTSPVTFADGDLYTFVVQNNINVEFSTDTAASTDESTANNFPSLLVTGISNTDINVIIAVTDPDVQTTAETPADYSWDLATRTVTISAAIYNITGGNTIAIPSPTLVNDSDIEGDETILLSIGYGTGANSGDSSDTGTDVRSTTVYTITDDDVLTSAPGGVTSDLVLWLKADADVQSTGNAAATSDDSVETWLDQSGLNHNHAQATATLQPTYKDGTATDVNLNFNPTISFDGGDKIDFTIGDVLGLTDDHSIIVVNRSNSTAFLSHPYSISVPTGNFNTAQGINIYSAGTAYRHFVSNTAQFLAFSPFIDQTPQLVSGTFKIGGNLAGRIDGIQKGSQTQTVNLSFNNSTRSSVGYGASKAYWTGDIAEVIVYKKEATATELHKIESYLALKYGVTLNVGAIDYVDATGTVLWNDTNYWNDVTGIGQDDTSELDQRISKSVNPKGIIAIANNNNFINTNLDASRTSLGDGNYLVWGNDNGSAQWNARPATGVTATDAPARYAILDKVWKVKETGTVGAVNIQIDVDDTDFNVPTFFGDLYMVKGTDLSTAAPVLMTNAGSGKYTLTGVDFTDGDLYSFIVKNEVTVSYDAATAASTDESAADNFTGLTLDNSSSTFGILNVEATINSTDAGTGSATASGTDYTLATPEIITIPVGDYSTTAGSATLATPTLNDESVVEATETVNLALASPSNASIVIGTQSTHIYTITDDDTATVSITADADADEATASRAFTLTMSAAASTDVEVNYTLTGTAANPADYTDATTVNGTVTISAGATTGTIDLTVVDNMISEGSETIITILTAATNNASVTATTTPATLNITDNDNSLNVSIAADADVDEATASRAFTLTMSGAAASDVEVSYTLTGTAANPADYTDATTVNGTVTISAGATTGTIDLTVVDDMLVEATETVIATLTAATNNASVTATTTPATLNITDNDNCNPPGNPTVSDIKITTVDLSWTAVSGVIFTGYEWAIVASGDDPLTDTLVATGTTAMGVTSVNDAGTLVQGTSYDFYVRTICSPTVSSSYSTATSFSTLADTDGDGTPDITDTDDDNDGVNDSDELLVGTDPLDPETTDGTPDGGLDTDGDGITNADESDETSGVATDTAPADGDNDIVTALDTDGDGTPDITDTDDDNDGVNDSDELLVGTDPLDSETTDGTPDGGLDTDGDGITNADESDETSGVATDTAPADGDNDIVTALDTDGDGTPDITDTDDDGDGVNDSDELLVGTDPLDSETTDGTPDGGLDTDGDGITNADESDETSGIATDTAPADGNPDITFTDTDGDGILNNTDTDDDGDGVSDADELLVGTDPLDSETTDGTPDGGLDTDGDGITNADESDETSGVATDTAPADGDNDIVTALDTDGDGTPDITDNDDDNDGVNDSDELLVGTDPLDSETTDGTPDGGLDTDGDGITNADESDETSGIATDTAPADGDNDIVTALDTDGDGTPDITDNDDDGDGVNDSDELLVGTDPLDPETTDGTPDGGLDTDGDGITNADESDETSGIATDTAPADGDNDIVTALDTDGDGTPDITDTDDDGDGVNDSDELLVGTNPLDPETTDGTPDGGLDTDGDGITNAEESDETSGIATDTAPADGNPDITFTDTDGDGILNNTDTDDDGDGVSDADELLVGTNPLDPETTDGTPDGSLDTDGDGITNTDESDETLTVPTDTMPTDGNNDITFADTDGDGIPNNTDTDDDGDGVSDADELLVGTNPLDSETIDGTPDGDIDSDMDGISNADESNETSSIATDTAPADGNPDITFADTDGDGIENAIDMDDDGDGVNDADEVLVGTNPLDPETIDGTPDGDIDSDMDGITNGDESDETSGVTTDTAPADGNPDITFVDSDGDGIENAIDTDDDGDGVNDADEVLVGSNPLDPETIDGTPDGDIDSDMDGITNGDESDETSGVSTDTAPADGTPDITFTDTDSDGIENVIDTDDDGDGVNDSDEALVGTNPLDPETTDGTPDGGLDFDMDGINNADESDETLGVATDAAPADGNPDITFTDTDSDGIDNATDEDDDGDGQTDVDESACGSDPLDSSSLSADNDSDDSPDCVDLDDDNDGQSDADETACGSNPLDVTSTSADNDDDNLPNCTDSDDDNDGMPDTTDEDDDGDGQTDAHEMICGTDPSDSTDFATDTDGDNIPDCVDEDDDGDGQSDADEIACGSNPLDSTSTSADADGDNLPNCSDPDDDNDGIADILDDDDDNDGQSDEDEIACGSDPLDPQSLALDTDGDSVPDCQDEDDDGDGQSDDDEITCGSDPLDGANVSSDNDLDGIPNCADDDNDNDGILDVFDDDNDGDGQSNLDELACGSDPLDSSNTALDTDGDGIPDCQDDDDDNDGTPDEEDAFPLDETEDTDTDGDGEGDNIDEDADDDGILDEDDLEPLLPYDPDGDDDMDGIQNYLEDYNGDGNPYNDDSDGDGIADFLEPYDPDADYDGDGVPNRFEDTNNDNNLVNDDCDEDGIPNFIDTDSCGAISAGAFTPNGDGINDTWVILGIEGYPFNTVKVYNRYGHEVYGARDYQNDWVGGYQDSREKLPPGSYYYLINLGDGSPPVDGWLFINY